MHRMIRLTEVGLVLLCAIVGTSIASAGTGLAHGPLQPATGYLFCTAIEPPRELPDESKTTGKTYYSNAFVMTGDNLKPVYEEFLAFLQKKYAFQKDPAGNQLACAGRHSLDEAVSAKRGFLDRAKANGQSAVETGWTFSGSTATEPAH